MAINKPQLALPDFLLEIAQQIFQESELPEKARCKTSVTLRRRFRGTSKSDLLGGFNPYAPEVWAGDGPEQELIMNMYGFHVVKPVIRANQSAMAQAEVECTVKPTSKDPKTAGVASIGTGIYKYFNNHPDYWSNNLKSQIAQQCQTDPGYFIRTYQDPDAESLINIALDEYSDEPLEQPGEYACAHCGAGGPMFSEQMGRAANGTMPCLNDECGERAEIISMPEMGEVSQFKGKTEYPAGNIVQEVVSAFQVRVDERKTKNGQLRRAEWLEHHFLMEEDDLQAMVPYFDIGTPLEWSYPLKWEYALETGTDVYLKPWQSDGMGRRRPQHEVRRIYMRPGRYRHYRAPADFTLDRGDGYAAVNREGKPMLSIKRGQSLTEIFPKGFWFVIANNQLLPIVEPCDLRDEWAYGGFLNDSASFWYQPASELNELQRAANNLYTIEMQHLESASIVTTFFDREWWDSDDFERGLSPTKEGVHIEPNDDISRHFKTATPPQLQGVMQGMEFIRSLVPDVSGVQPAAVGAPAKGEPYAAQRLQRQQSLGLLTPAQQSMAMCKSIVVMQHLRLAQKYKPVEWFQYIGTLYGKEWKEQDIELFLNSNLELDIVVAYKEGSEIPSSVIEQELKLRDFLLSVAQIAQYVPGVVDTEMVTELLSKQAALAGIDFDPNNVEADQRLADSRYQKIKSWLDFNRDSGMPENVLVDLALADRSLEITSGEKNETHIELWEDNIRALIAAEDPDYPLISACVKMVERHQEAIKVQMQVKSEREVEGHAPEIAAQMAAAQQQAQAEEQQQAEKLKIEAAVRAQDNQVAIERQALTDAAKAERERTAQQNQAQIKAAELFVKMAEINSRVPPEQDPERDPRDLIAESIDYEDLAPAAQSTILNDIGLPTAGVKSVNQATLTQAQIAATKARASQPRSNGASR